jgi:NADPH2:quinone reductase
MIIEGDAFHAWRCHAFGDYHDLTLEMMPAREPQAGEVLLATRAFAAGFPDMLMVQGGYQLKPPLPFTPCSEFGAEVLEVGPGVSEFKPGDRVMGSARTGAAAERIIAKAVDCLAMPETFDFAHGAAFVIGYKTAYVALVVRGLLAPGEVLLVHGAAGGVGLAAVALAKSLGARVIGMATGAQKLALISARGADHVIDYRDGDFREKVKALTDGRGADVIYDPIGGEVFEQSMRCIAPFGRLLVIGFASGRIPTLAVNHALIKQVSVIGVRAGEYGRLNPAGGRAVHHALGELAGDARLLPHIHARLPMHGLVAAFDTIATRQVSGRVVIECPLP